MSQGLLQLTDVRKSFGNILAIDGLSLSIQEEEILALIGPNGAGKTTALNLLSGELKPDSGTIEYKGENLIPKPPHEIANMGIGRSFQITNVFFGLTALENIRLATQAGGMEFDFSHFLRDKMTWDEPLEEAQQTLELIGLFDVKDEEVGTLPYGQQRRLEVGISAAMGAEVLLLDEPTGGMSPSETQEMTSLINEISEDRTIVIIEHDMDVVMELADRIAVMNKGKLVAEGSPADIEANEKVQEVYLGRVDKDETSERPAGESTESSKNDHRILDVSNINTFYGPSQILHDVSFEIYSGETVAILGRNGAGKTTTIRSIANLTPPRSGEIKFKGEEILGLKPHLTRRKGISWVPETRRVFAHLTVKQNIDLAAGRGSISPTRIYELFPRLEERKEQEAGTLSGGEQQMLAIARSIVGIEPELILLDEPMEGLAPQIIDDIKEAIQELSDEGKNILLVEQSVDVALDLADRVYLLEKGEIVHEATPSELEKNQEKLRKHLGVVKKRV